MYVNDKFSLYLFYVCVNARLYNKTFAKVIGRLKPAWTVYHRSSNFPLAENFQNAFLKKKETRTWDQGVLQHV